MMVLLGGHRKAMAQIYSKMAILEVMGVVVGCGLWVVGCGGLILAEGS